MELKTDMVLPIRRAGKEKDDLSLNVQPLVVIMQFPLSLSIPAEIDKNASAFQVVRITR